MTNQKINFMQSDISPALPAISTGTTGLKAGFITLASLILYFFVMKFFNFMDNPVAWAFNFVILATGVILSFEYYRAKTTLNVDYIPGMVLGTTTTAVAVFPFAFFIHVYFSADRAL